MKNLFLATLSLLFSTVGLSADVRSVQADLEEAIRLRQQLGGMGLDVRHFNKEVSAEGSSSRSGAARGSVLIGLGAASSSYNYEKSRFVVFEKTPYYTNFTLNMNFEQTWADTNRLCTYESDDYQSYRAFLKRGASEQQAQEVLNVREKLRSVLGRLELAAVKIPTNDLVLLPKVNELLTWARSSQLTINKFYFSARTLSTKDAPGKSKWCTPRTYNSGNYFPAEKLELPIF